MTLPDIQPLSPTQLLVALVSFAIGSLIGLERRTTGKSVGIRTFGLVSLASTLAWWQAPEVAYALLVLCIPFVTVLNVHSLLRDGSLETTTSLAVLGTALLGICVAQGQVLPAAACAVVLTALLAWKAELSAFANVVTPAEIRGALLLGLLGLVIYPSLPNGPVDPWGLLDVRGAWVAVIGISCIGFLNYVLLRLWGTRGIGWTGLLGGAVNSRAVAIELATRARQSPEHLWPFAVSGIMAANIATVLRNAVLLGLFAPRALRWGWLPLGFMCGTGTVLALLTRRQTRERPTLQLTSPVSLKHVLGFGALFLVIGTAGQLAQRTVGHAGFLVVTVAGGLVSSASSVVAAAALAGQGKVQPASAAVAVVLASITTIMSNTVATHLTGRDRRYTKRVAGLTAIVVLAGIAGLLLVAMSLGHGQAI